MPAVNQSADLVLPSSADVRIRSLYHILLPVVYGVVLLIAFFLSYVAVFDKKIDLNGDAHRLLSFRKIHCLR